MAKVEWWCGDMFSGSVNVSSNDRSRELQRILDDIKKLDVLVGIPQEKSSRPGETITNAELAFVHTNGVRARSMRDDMFQDVQEHGYHAAYDMYIMANGSPLWQSPPRPIIEPAIENDKETISELLGKALQCALNGDKQGAMRYLNLAGMEGQTASQEWFTDPANGWPANADSTIEMKGSDRPLIDTGELRKSITFVVREKD